MDDLISRQAAIDAFWKLEVELRPSAIDAVLDMLKNLPSVQPKLSNNSKELDNDNGELIGREEAIGLIKEYERDSTCPLDYVSIIRQVPSVPRKGKWIYGEHDVTMCDGYRCDKCGFFVPWDYQHKFIDFIKDYNYCPSCGADMRGEEE